MQSEEAIARNRRPVWIGGAIALVITVITVIALWTLALPVTPPDTVCIAIYPPPAGCAGDARVLPAAVWSILSVASTAATLLFARKGWWGATAGVALTALIGFAGYFATLYMRVLLFV